MSSTGSQPVFGTLARILSLSTLPGFLISGTSKLMTKCQGDAVGGRERGAQFSSSLYFPQSPRKKRELGMKHFNVRFLPLRALTARLYIPSGTIPTW